MYDDDHTDEAKWAWGGRGSAVQRKSKLGNCPTMGLAKKRGLAGWGRDLCNDDQTANRDKLTSRFWREDRHFPLRRACQSGWGPPISLRWESVSQSLSLYRSCAEAWTLCGDCSAECAE